MGVKTRWVIRMKAYQILGCLFCVLIGIVIGKLLPDDHDISKREDILSELYVSLNEIEVRVLTNSNSLTFHYAGEDRKFAQMHDSLVSDENPFGINVNDPCAKDDVYSNSLVVLSGSRIKISAYSSDGIYTIKNLEGSMDFQFDVIPGLSNEAIIVASNEPASGMLVSGIATIENHRSSYKSLDRDEFREWLNQQSNLIEEGTVKVGLK